MATSGPFQVEMDEMETLVRQFGDEAVVPDFHTLFRFIRCGFLPDLLVFHQIIKVARYRAPRPLAHSV
jgi:hypothetical protein